MDTLAGVRVVVVGMSRSGVAAASLAVAMGAEVIGVDLRASLPAVPGVRLELGPHRHETLLGADLIVVSPGVPASQPDLVAAAAYGVPVVGELVFAASFIDAPLIAITGTNGKSTTTSFVGQLLAACGHRPFVGGNLGDALSLMPVDHADADFVVAEVSSYQLELDAGVCAPLMAPDLPGLRPRAAAILNLTPDHLARHGTMERYAEAKAKLFRRLSGVGIVPAHGGPGGALIQAALRDHIGPMRYIGGHGVRVEGARAFVDVPEASFELELSELAVPGAHNLENAAVAAALAASAGVPVAALQAAIPKLVALDHRMQIVARARDVLWINDSKATNVDAARVGIAGIDRMAFVLLGGQAKGPGFGALGPSLARHVAVVFGEAGPQIAVELRAVGVETIRVTTLEDAVSVAASAVRPGQAVLLSPACASFDAFTDFEHRGRVFTALARAAAGEVT
jgi:UDP-N-acetylmuramoylalanine--D-glutamate ligase